MLTGESLPVLKTAVPVHSADDNDRFDSERGTPVQKSISLKYEPSSESLHHTQLDPVSSGGCLLFFFITLKPRVE